MTTIATISEQKPTQSSQQEKLLKKTQLLPSVCRCCRFYKFQGRSSGHCQKLGGTVCSHWHSCPLALPPFAPSWEQKETEWNS